MQASSQARNYSEKSVIARIKEGGMQRERALNEFFQANLKFLPQLQHKYQFSENEALEAYSDAVIEVARHIEIGQFEGRSKLSTYFFRIFSHKCIDLLRRFSTNRVEEVQLTYETERSERNTPQSELETKEAFEGLMQYFERLGKNCKQILMDWAYHGYSMDEIAQRAGLKDRRAATSRKYNCFQELKQLMANG